MMDAKKALYNQGRADAQATQKNAPDMSGTELYDFEDSIPDFTEAVKTNMLKRKIGFVCKSTSGRIVRLIQPYDSEIYTAEPEKLPAQWGFAWSTNPEKALPFIAISTSPYNTGDCCIDNEVVWRSKIDSNVFKPTDYPDGWERA